MFNRTELMKVRGTALKLFPYFSPIAYRLLVFEMSEGTACVTADWRLGFNPRWWDTLTPDERVGVYVHELLHLYLQHGRRAKALGVPHKGPSRQAWGIATDLVINQVVVREGVKLPDCGVTPANQGLPPGLTEEKYLVLLLDKMKGDQDDDSDQSDSGDSGDSGQEDSSGDSAGDQTGEGSGQQGKPPPSGGGAGSKG